MKIPRRALSPGESAILCVTSEIRAWSEKSDQALVRLSCPTGGSEGKAADSFRPERGVGAIERGWNEWAGEAKRVGRDALFCGLPEGGMQMCAMQAQVRQDVPGNLIS